MDRLGALDYLGLYPDSTEEWIELAYAKKRTVLKRLLLNARTMEVRNRARRALRNLTVVRDLALGPEGAKRRRLRRQRERRPRAEDSWTPKDGVPEGLSERADALAFFCLTRDAPPEDVRAIFHQRSRTLKRHIAHADTGPAMQNYQQMLGRLNDLLTLAVFDPKGSSLTVTPSRDPAPRQHETTEPNFDPENTLTDVTSLSSSEEDEPANVPQDDLEDTPADETICGEDLLTDLSFRKPAPKDKP